MSIGENLKQARAAKKLSQGTLAEKVGAGKTTYISWEHDTNPPPADKLILLAQELDTTVNKLLFGQSTASDEIEMLLRRFEALPDATKPNARRMLKALLFTLEAESEQHGEAAA